MSSIAEKRRKSLKTLLAPNDGQDAPGVVAEAPAVVSKDGVSSDIEKSPESAVSVPRVDGSESGLRDKLSSEKITFNISEVEKARVDKFISEDVAPCRTYSEICRRALMEFLEREEPLLEQIKEFQKKQRQR